MSDSDPSPPTARPAQATLRARVVSALGATFAILALDRVIQILILAVLARLLTPAEVGVAAAATIFVSFLTMFSQFGVGPALIQSPHLDDRMVSAARVLTFASSLTIFVAIEVFAPLAGVWFRNSEITVAVRVLALICLIQAFVTTHNAVLARNLRAKDIAITDVVCAAIGNGAVAIPMALLGWSYWALIGGAVASVVCKVVILGVIAKLPRLSRFGMADARRLWTMGPGFLLTTFLQRLLNESDRLIIGRYLSAADLGLYSRANGLMAVPSNFFGAVLDRVGFPAFAQVQTEPARLENAYAQAISLTSLIGLPLTVFMVITGPDIILVILGAGWAGAIAPFKVLCLAAYFRLSDRMSGLVLRATGKPYRMAVLQIILGIATISGVLAVWPQGITAISVVIVGVALLSFLLMSFFAMHIVGLRLRTFLYVQRNGAVLALLTAVATIPVMWASDTWETSPFTTLAAACVSAGSLCLIAILIAPRFFLLATGGFMLFERAVSFLRGKFS